MLQKLRLYNGKTIGLNPQRVHDLGTLANLVVYQVVAESLPFELDVVFESDSADAFRRGAKSYPLWTTLVCFIKAFQSPSTVTSTAALWPLPVTSSTSALRGRFRSEPKVKE